MWILSLLDIKSRSKKLWALLYSKKQFGFYFRNGHLKNTNWLLLSQTLLQQIQKQFIKTYKKHPKICKNFFFISSNNKIADF